jgi:hypothetical protein
VIFNTLWFAKIIFFKNLVYYARVGKKPGKFEKPMGMGKTGFYREKWEKREKLPFFKYMFKKHVKSLANKWWNVLMAKIINKNSTKI